MQIADASSNRFDLLRLVFAGLVAIYHLIVLADLTRQGEPAFASLAELSIQGFFIVSGALVFESFERSRDVLDYAGKRLRRLYPAYATVVILAALGALLATGAWRETGVYLLANLAFLNFLAPEVPGLFADQRFSAINGALWTIKIEVLFYMIVPLIAFPLSRVGSAGKAILIGLIYLGAEVWRGTATAIGPVESEIVARQLPGQMSFFASGIALALLRSGSGTQGLFLSGAAAVSILLPLSFVPGLEPLRAAGLAGAIAVCAFAPGPTVAAARFGDISYGLYLVHFPVIQVLVETGLFDMSPVAGSLLSLVVTLAASFALWYAVEKPMLRRSSHYRRAERRLDAPVSALQDKFHDTSGDRHDALRND